MCIYLTFAGITKVFVNLPCLRGYYLPPADRPGTGDYKMPSVRACVRSSRFYKSLSISKTIIARASKFAGYIHHWKNLPVNLFLLILKNKMAATGVNKMAAVDFFSTLSKGLIAQNYS